jgi:hypothetical protein
LPEGLAAEFKVDPIGEDSSEEDQCWTGMVHNPVIAEGYPIPNRVDPTNMMGLELSLDLMVALSHANWATIFEDTLLLKGDISALVPVRKSDTSIVWHFRVNKGMSRENSIISAAYK